MEDFPNPKRKHFSHNNASSMASGLVPQVAENPAWGLHLDRGSKPASAAPEISATKMIADEVGNSRCVKCMLLGGDLQPRAGHQKFASVAAAIGSVQKCSYSKDAVSDPPPGRAPAEQKPCVSQRRRGVRAGEWLQARGLRAALHDIVRARHARHACGRL